MFPPVVQTAHRGSASIPEKHDKRAALFRGLFQADLFMYSQRTSEIRVSIIKNVNTLMGI